MPHELIEKILKSLEFLADSEDSDVASLFASASASAKASSSRAMIAKSKLGMLATRSVAASASSTLHAYLSSPDRNPERDEAMRLALLSGIELVRGFELTTKKRVAPDVDEPEGWQKDSGAFYLTTPFGRAEVFYNPHMPGGDWTLQIEGLPVSFAHTPIENVLFLNSALDFLEGPRRPFANRNPFSQRRMA